MLEREEIVEKERARIEQKLANDKKRCSELEKLLKSSPDLDDKG